jgi:LmbE family N-acetylglucosaminyl deacetylase
MSLPPSPVLELCDQHAIRHAQMVDALGPGPWLTVSPHDDDFIIGMGLTTMLGQKEGVEVHAAVLTDGSLGYVTPEEKPGLVARRTAELVAACALIGMPPERLHRFELVDGSLANAQGCRADPDAPTAAQKLVGLLRSVRPKVVFVCTPTDTHPDHRAAASETAIACVWASSRIWLDLGEPIESPQVYYYAVYAPFDAAPQYEVRADPAQLETKLAALQAFESQGVIEPLLDRLRGDGPYEYVCRVAREPYRPRVYRRLFARAERRL